MRIIDSLTLALLGCAGAVGAVGGCSGSHDVTIPAGATVTPGAPSGEHVESAGPSAASCTACLSDSDCGSGVCAQFDGDMFCAQPCPKRCANGTHCTSIQTAHGATVRACIPTTNTCGGGSGGATTGSSTGGTTGGGTTGGGTTGGGTTGGGTTGGGTTGSSTGGTTGGAFGADGGTLDTLRFAIVGDTRPAVIDDTSAYPSAIIGQIYSSIAALSPMPAFAVSTGDYQFSSASGPEAQPQFAKYVAARGSYPGYLFPAFGNHECTGATKSNCGPSGTDGITNNYSAFVSALLSPIGKTQPYYSIQVKATSGAWTAKFVFVAANAWDSAQQSWLDGTLAQPTTYTFIIRHESHSASGGPPGLSGSEAIMANHPYTLAIVGHTHTYKKSGPKEVLFGNGGAPITGGVNYGFGLVTMRSDGALQVDAIDYQSGQPDTTFRFAVNADGSAAP